MSTGEGREFISLCGMNRLDKRERTYDEIRIYLFHDACESWTSILSKSTQRAKEVDRVPAFLLENVM